MSYDDLAAVPDAGPGLETAHAEVRALLEQRDLTAAGDRCARLLQDYPDDPTGHVLMGDIAAGRQRWAEAVDWYRRAEALGGGEEATRRRQAATAMLPRTPAAPEADEPLPELHRQRARVLAIFGASGVVVILAVILALMAFRTGGPESAGRPAGSGGTAAAPGGGLRTPTPAPSTGAPGGVATLPPVVAPPVTSAPSPPASAGPGTAAPAVPPSARPPVIITRRMDVPATDEDFLIAKAIGSLTWPDGTSMSGDVSVMMDPYQAYCIVTFRIPDTLRGGNLQETVVAQAYKVIVAVLQADAAASYVTVRAIASITTAERRRTALQAFRANMSRESLEAWRKVLPNPTPQQLRDQVLAQVWWNPAIPTDTLR